MAGASMNDIKARMKSVTSTMQITKAMELVATSKLRRAKERAETSRPFREVSEAAVAAILGSDESRDSAYAGTREIRKVCYIVIAGDRGLAGGYNNNIFRMTKTVSDGQNAVFLPIGKKALDTYRHRGTVVSDAFPCVADLGVGDSLHIAQAVCKGFVNGEYDKVVLVYTRFASMISQIPVYQTLLPLQAAPAAEGNKPAPVADGTSIGEVLDSIVPGYLGGVIYSAIAESVASESGARRCAMNAANKNASEMMDALTLRFNRARQAIITQEITEIVSGAEAL